MVLHITSFLSWILASDSRHTLRELGICVEELGSVHVGHFLREVGPRLEHLQLFTHATPDDSKHTS